jgi:BioD-like phosphotransacetylase family protein
MPYFSIPTLETILDHEKSTLNTALRLVNQNLREAVASNLSSHHFRDLVQAWVFPSNGV